MAKRLDGTALFGANVQFGNSRVFVQRFASSFGAPVSAMINVITSPIPTPFKLVFSAPLSTSKWVYNLVKNLVVNIVKISIGETTTSEMKMRQIGIAFINEMYNSKQKYHDECVSMQLGTCEGLALIFGYPNPSAEFIRQQCRAIPQLIEGLYDLLLSITVDAYMARIMCVNGVGSNLYQQIMAVAYEQAPLVMQPMLMSYIQQNTETDFICRSMLQQTQTAMSRSMQPWFETQFRSTEALASLVDHIARMWGDEKAGMCLDFNVNPHLVTLIPHPVDYFRACANTKLCESKCQSEYDAFNTARQLYSQQSLTSTVTNNVVAESKMFRGDVSADSFVPMNILDLIQLSDCTNICNVDENSPSNCVAIVGVPTFEEEVTIRKYCVPHQMNMAVFEQKIQRW